MFFLFSIDFFFYIYIKIFPLIVYYFFSVSLIFFKCWSTNFAYNIESEEMCVRSHIGLTTTS